MGGYMSDDISSDSYLELGNVVSAFGLGSIHDNHGNTTDGRELSCADGHRYRMNFRDWNDLHTAITGFEKLKIVADRRGDEVLGGMVSPLKWMCKQMADHQKRGVFEPHSKQPGAKH
jgi:hypothetical protein